MFVQARLYAGMGVCDAAGESRTTSRYGSRNLPRSRRHGIWWHRTRRCGARDDGGPCGGRDGHLRVQGGAGCRQDAKVCPMIMCTVYHAPRPPRAAGCTPCSLGPTEASVGSEAAEPSAHPGGVDAGGMVLLILSYCAVWYHGTACDAGRRTMPTSDGSYRGKERLGEGPRLRRSSAGGLADGAISQKPTRTGW